MIRDAMDTHSKSKVTPNSDPNTPVTPPTSTAPSTSAAQTPSCRKNGKPPKADVKAPESGPASSDSVLHTLKQQNKHMRDNMTTLHKENLELRSELQSRRQGNGQSQETVDQLRKDKNYLANEVTELRKRINGYQNLSYMYQEKAREASLYKMECERLKAPRIPADVPTVVTNGSAPQGAAATQVSEGSDTTNIPSSRVQDVPAATAGVTDILHMEDPIMNWSMSQASVERPSDDEKTASLLEDSDSECVSEVMPGLQQVSEWMCQVAGMGHVSPLAQVLIRLVLSVLRKEKEIYKTKQGTNPKGKVSESGQQSPEHKELLTNAIKNLKEQEKANLTLHQQVRKLETEKHNIEMERKIWTIEQDCLKEQMRSLKLEVERCQQENLVLRSNLERMNCDMASNQTEESLRGLSPRELMTEVAVLRHQVTVYKEDFDRERLDRAQTQTEKSALQAEKNQIKQDLERKTEQLVVKEGEYTALLEKFNTLSSEYCHRVQELARLRPLMESQELQGRPLPFSPSYLPGGATAGSPLSPPRWICEKCTVINVNDKNSCSLCLSPRRNHPFDHHIHRPEWQRQQGYIAHGRIECDTRNPHEYADVPLPSILPEIEKE